LYFLREKGLWATEAGIKLDGQPVGSVSKGFYFSVDRPPGRYRITCVNPVSMDYEAEVQIEGGQTYYFGIGTPQTGAPGQDLLNQAVSGSSGRQLRSTSLLMSGFSGAALNPSFCNGPFIVNPFFVVRSPGSCFCTGSARGRHLMGLEEDEADQSTGAWSQCHRMGCGLT
jgi:hypothetical protein